MLFGWYIIKDRNLVDQWEKLLTNGIGKNKKKGARKKTQTKPPKIGKILVENNIVPPYRLEMAERAQEYDLSKIREAMAEDFLKRKTPQR